MHEKMTQSKMGDCCPLNTVHYELLQFWLFVTGLHLYLQIEKSPVEHRCMLI